MKRAASQMPAFFSTARNSIEDVIFCYLEYLAIDDAIVLAELYNAQVHTTDSLYVLAQSLLRAGRTQSCYKLLSVGGQDTPQLKYLFAKCCYALNKMDEAEQVLRADNDANLHPFFEGHTVEPFARALLARIFTESGRAEEARRENRVAVEMNVLSWSAVKALCDLGAANEVDDVYRHLSWRVDLNKGTGKPAKARKSEKPTKSDAKTPTCSEIKAPCLAPKKKAAPVRKLTHMSRHQGGVETRRSCRVVASQDSENVSTAGTGRELRGGARGHQQGMGPSRSTHDKQLRSMNRINEMEVSSVPLKVSRSSPASTPSIHKLLDSDPKPRRTRSDSQSAVSPLADKNAQTKVEDVAMMSCSESPSGQEVSRCQNCLTVAHPFVVTSVHSDISSWPAELVQMLQSLLQAVLMQMHLSRYKTKQVIDDDLPLCMPRTQQAPLLRELVARAYSERLDYAKARELFEALHKEFPYRVAGMEVLSTVLWHAQDARSLSLLAAELTQDDRNSAETWCVAGNCFSVQKQHDKAVDCFERAIYLNPTFYYAYSLLGHELLDTDQLDKAASAFGRAVLLCPVDYRAWFGLGLMHFKREHLRLARSYLLKAVNINPYNSVVLCQLSVIEQALHNDSAAMELLQRALKITPESAACRFYRARLLYEKHEYAKCRDELNQLKLYAHDEAQVFFLLGRVYKKLGNTHMALLNFSWAAEMDPRGEQSHNSLAEGPYDDEPSE